MDDQQKREETTESPEVHEEYVKEDLDQENVTHQGEWRTGEMRPDSETDGGGKHLGAVDHEVVPIVPPMAGPADVVGEKNENAQGNESGDTEVGEEMVDPRDHLTPG